MASFPDLHVVFDFDGVIRHHDPVHEADSCAELGLRPGRLAAMAFQHELMSQLVRGGHRRADWIAEVGRRAGNLPEVIDRDAAVDAVDAWLADWGRVDAVMVEILDALRSQGLPVALLTNGTDTTPAELEHHGLDGAFGWVFNSWELAVAKPDPRIFHAVSDSLGCRPNQVVFFDDTLVHVAAAQSVGWKAHRFTSAVKVREQLAKLGVAT